MQDKLIAAGFGGQGILFMSRLVAYCGMTQELHTTWMPSYGAEVRGGTAHAMVVLSDEPIASPIIKEPTSCIVMNLPSLGKFEHCLIKGGLLIVNSSLISDKSSRDDIDVLYVPATDIASDIGDTRVANMVMLGAYLSRRDIITQASVQDALKCLLSGKKEEFISVNEEAIAKGMSFQGTAV